LRLKSRFYNSLAQGLPGKYEQPVRPPWGGAPRGAGPNAPASDTSA